MAWRGIGKGRHTNDVLLVDVDWDGPEEYLCVSIGAGSFAMIPINVLKEILEENGYKVTRNKD